MASVRSETGAIDKILQIQLEIQRISKHGREHVRTTGEIMRLDKSCSYCSRHSLSDELCDNKNNEETKKMTGSLSGTINELERVVQPVGRNAHVTVPRGWAGKRVRISLLE